MANKSEVSIRLSQIASVFAGLYFYKDCVDTWSTLTTKSVVFYEDIINEIFVE